MGEKKKRRSGVDGERMERGWRVMNERTGRGKKEKKK